MLELSARKYLFLALGFVLSGVSATGAQSSVPAALVAMPTYETLVDLISQRGLTSIDDFLAHLPAQYRSQFALAYFSQSIQYADSANPRVIMYGPDATMVIAFTCDPKDCIGRPQVLRGKILANGFVQKGFDRLEVIQWRGPTRSFEFREITFPKQVGGKVFFSRKNPARCLSCHGGKDPRPNWASYPRWDGFYGGNDDFLKKDLFFGKKGSFKIPMERRGLLPDESREALQQFIKSAPNRLRYRHLVELKEGFEIDESGSGRSRHLHNARLTDYLATFNFKRIVRLMRANPFYSQIKHQVLALLMMDDRAALTRDLFGPLPVPLQSCFDLPMDYESLYSQSVNLVRNLFHSLGSDTDSWSMAFPVSLNGGFGTPVIPNDELAAQLALEDSELAKFVRVLSMPVGDYARYRALVAKREPNVWSDLLRQTGLEWAQMRVQPGNFRECVENPQGLAAELKSPKHQIEVCLDCHSSNNIGPQIALDDMKQLTDYDLRKIQGRLAVRSSKRMPLDGPYLSEEDQERLLEYIQRQR